MARRIKPKTAEVAVPQVSESYLTAEQVSEKLQVSRQTLSYWRSKNTGPVSIKVGAALRYPEGEFAAWMEKNRVETARGERISA